MPEIAGDATLLVDPFKPEEITAAIRRIFTDNKIRLNLIEKGFIQAKKFSWRIMAQHVLEMYSEIGDKINKSFGNQ